MSSPAGRAGPTSRPPALAPMLAGGTVPPRDLSGFVVEPKWDGVRIIVTVHEGKVRLTSRNGRDVTSHYPELAGMAADLGGRSVVLDGEVVAFDERGATSFQKLQSRMHVAKPAPELLAEVPVAAMVFDLLWLDGELLTGLPHRERRRRLEELAGGGDCWRLTPFLPPATHDELLRACEAVGFEGYVAKKPDAPYLPGRRSPAWIKVKCRARQEVVVGGWIEGSGGRRGSIGSLAVGLYEADPATGRATGKLRYLGAVGSGLTDDWIRQLRTVAERLATDDSPFAEHVVGVHFLDPRLVAEVSYTLITETAILRHPVLHGFRTDVDADGLTAGEEMAEGLARRPDHFRITA